MTYRGNGNTDSKDGTWLRSLTKNPKARKGSYTAILCDVFWSARKRSSAPTRPAFSNSGSP
jgi:hypothetical protein